MENVLEVNQAIPDDKEFIKIVINKVLSVLQYQYLSKTSTCGYYDSLLQYDWTSEEGKYITIPQSIGLINKLIETTKPSRTIKQELYASLLEHSPSLIPDKLIDIKNPRGDHIVTPYPLIDKAKLHELLSQIDEHQMEKLFSASGFNISQVWTMQQEFALAKHLYIAATTYGENNSACITGIWSQIIDTAAEIDSHVLDIYDDHKKNNIYNKSYDHTHNTQTIIAQIFNTLLKYIDSQDNKVLLDAAQDLVLGMIGIIVPDSFNE